MVEPEERLIIALTRDWPERIPKGTKARTVSDVLPIIVLAAAYLDIGYYRNSMTWRRCVEIWERSYKPALEQEHFGYCNKEPQACFRCQAEDCIEIARIIEEGLRDD